MQPRFFKNLGPIDLKKIKMLIECSTYEISDDAVFFNITSIDKLKKNELSFLSNTELINDVDYSVGTIICTEIIRKRFKGKPSLIIVKDTQTAISILSNSFYRSFTNNEIDSLEKPRIDHNCEIDKTAVIENGSIIGNNVKIGHGCFIGYNSIIGDNTSIDSNSVITNSIIAENVAIGRNVSIGQQGFGFAINRNENIKIQHIGKVILQSGVSIGSNCTIDRGSFSDTIIGENSYFDNLCHIAHNVIIGNNCIFAGMSGIAGSTIVGNNVMAGGQTGIAGHLKIGNNVRIAAQSGVLTNIQDNSSVMGHPAINKFKYIKKYKKNYA
tara:strand:- start:3411 stop:4388 length:978 start_codon:yes stop_codon:yes gene_type:complete